MDTLEQVVIKKANDAAVKKADSALTAASEALEAIRDLGRQEGREEGRENGVKAFLSSTKFSVKEIAELLRVDISCVNGIKEKISAQSKRK